MRLVGFEPAKNIILMGEVKYSGVYTLLRKDEKISAIIKRAGGLTNYAYMDGVKMFRKFEIKNKCYINVRPFSFSLLQVYFVKLC